MILGDLSSGKIVLLALVGLFVFGPDRLPRVAKDLGRILRQVRELATNVGDDIRSEVGPEIADLDLSALNPKTFVTKHLFSDEEDVISLDKAGEAPDRAAPPNRPPSASSRTPSPRARPGSTRYDSDAT